MLKLNCRFVPTFARLTLLAIFAPALALAQTYPVKPVRMIVGFATGGGTDTAARLLAQKLSASDALAQPVVVENRVGASGAIASELVAKSAPDGYTLLMMANAETIQPALGVKLPYDIERDFAPVSMVGVTPFVLAVHPSLPVRNVRQLTDLARSRPGDLTYGTSGVGSPAHLMSELFNSMAKVKITGVPYKGSSQFVIAVASGEISMAFVSIPSIKPLLDSGRVRGLAISTAKRSALLPSIPTVAESGVPGFDMAGSWFAVLAPAGTPKNIVSQLSSVIGKVLRNADTMESLNRQGIEPQPNTPEQLATLIHHELTVNTKLIRTLGIKAP